MATYKLTSRKTGKSRSGLTLGEALTLTKLNKAAFSRRLRMGILSLSSPPR